MDDDLAMSWDSWITDYEIYAVAAGVTTKTERIQCCIFLHIAGKAARNVYKTMHFESGEKDKITPLIEAFSEYCDGATNIVVTRFRFFHYDQTTQSIDTYITELRNKVPMCDFGDREESLLRDRIVGGVADEDLQELLLRTKNLDLKKCIEICRISEVTAAQVKNNQQPVNEKAVDMVQKYKGQEKKTLPANQPTWPRRESWARGPTVTTRGSTVNGRTCDRCGYVHRGQGCPAAGKTCNSCRKVGHFAQVCRSKQQRQVWDIQEVDQYEQYAAIDGVEQEQMDDLFVGEVRNADNHNDLWFREVTVGKTQRIRFKLDTGSEANIISRAIFEQLDDKVVLEPPRCRLVTYSGHRIVPQGETTIDVNGQSLKFQVVNNGSPILGKRACQILNLIRLVNSVAEVTDRTDHREPATRNNGCIAEKMVKEYIDVFTGLGCIKTNTIIHVNNEIEPVIDPPRRIPYAIQDQVKKEITRMLDIGVIVRQEQPTEWVNSITIVQKPNKIRVCLDPTKLNKAIKRGPFPTKTIEEVAAKVAGATVFSVLDANSGYWQVELSEASSKLTTFNTPWGRYRYTRLPFGIKTAGDIFIEVMNEILGDLEGVQVITDDILIFGETEEIHNKRLEAVLVRAREMNLKLNPNKSKINKAEVEYVGHVLSKEGLKPNPNRIQAIIDMPEPTDKQAVQRFLGMMNYVAKFIPNLSETAKPLRVLLAKETAWHWDDQHKQSFQKLKELLTKAPVLRYYDVNKQIVLQVDACKSGLGAALMQEKRPIAMASKALNEAQSNYAVIEKELLAICFGCSKFHEYVYGKDIIIETDHKPLIAIMIKPIHKLSARMQRMRLRLQNYNVTVRHLSGSQMFFADTLSRTHPKEVTASNFFDESLKIASIELESNLIQKIINETNNDSTLRSLKIIINLGWPETCAELKDELKGYYNYREELTVENQLVLKGSRIVIPRALQKNMLERIHESHMGMVKTKQLARDTIFWPGIDQQIEANVAGCETCQNYRNNVNREPMISHEIINAPYVKIAVDLFELEGRNYILFVDYYSKFPDVMYLSNLSSKTTITAMKGNFSRFGIPNAVVSDNGPQFNSQEYRVFAESYGFTPIFSSPKNPQSNGQAERCVQTIKKLIKKAVNGGNDPHLALLNYRNTPIDGFSLSPAQMLMSRRLRSRIPMLPKKLEAKVNRVPMAKVKKRQETQKKYYDRRVGPMNRVLVEGDNVRYKNYKDKWIPGKIKSRERIRNRNYVIQNNKGKEIIRNRKLMFKVPKEQDIGKSNEASDIDRYQQSATRQSVNSEKTGNDSFRRTAKTDKYMSRYGRVVRRVHKMNL